MKKLLIIEDEEYVRNMLKTFFEDEGYKVISANNGQTGIKYFREQPVKTVITDIFMTEKNDVEVIVEIRRMSPETKIIAISGGGEFSNIPEGKNQNNTALLDASYIFKKPIDLNVLSKAVEKTLSFC